MIYKSLFLLLLITIIASCSSINENQIADNEKKETPENMYVEGKLLLNDENFIESKLKFNQLIKLFPLSNEAIQAEILIGFIDYANMEYENAVMNFQRIILKYPSHKNLDYVYYMLAMCNYERINNEGLDGKFNDLALESFYQIINRYPYSQYAQDSRQKIILINSNKAAKHMTIGKFYLNDQKYTAALNRFKIVIEKYSETKFTPEALYRSVEIYNHLGMITESKNTASVLGYNYPDSEWYEYAYNLINKNENKKSFFSKLKNKF